MDVRRRKGKGKTEKQTNNEKKNNFKGKREKGGKKGRK